MSEAPSMRFPGESAEYRLARDRLLEAEIEPDPAPGEMPGLFGKPSRPAAGNPSLFDKPSRPTGRGLFDEPQRRR
jgi:hypothetical protein